MASAIASHEPDGPARVRPPSFATASSTNHSATASLTNQTNQLGFRPLSYRSIDDFSCCFLDEPDRVSTSFLQEKMNMEDDPVLSILCYEKDDDIGDDVLSIEDWSGSEQHYHSDIDEHDDPYPCYDPKSDWKSMKPVVGMKFESPAKLKESLIDYGVSDGYSLAYLVNDHSRLLVRCGKEETEVDGEGNKKKVWKCPFRLWASRLTNEDSFQIRTLDDNHTCSRSFFLGSLVTYSWIAKRYSKHIIQNPEISLREIQEDIKEKYACRVSLGQCGRAKKKVLDEFEGNLKEHYARLADYQAEILVTNPGSNVKMDVNTMENGDVYFSSFYICFNKCQRWMDRWV